jgi:hypothetical protein
MQAGGLLELLAWNDAHRRADVDDGLVCVDEWARGAFFGAYTPEFPTLAPRAWSSTPPMAQDEYTARFESRLPEIAAVLRDLENVCVAGGAACMPFCGDFGDVDLFVYGLGAERAALWRKADEVAARVRDAFSDARCVTETLSPGVLTFFVFRGHECPSLTIQLILRAYATLSAAVHGFDVGSCSVCYDGRVARMTRLAAFCVAHRVNVVHPPYRSPSYVHRLVKNFGRGFALVFVGLRRGALERGATLELAGGEMCVTPSVVRGLVAVGDVRAAKGACESDYDAPRRRSECARARHASFCAIARNVEQVAKGGRRFVVVGASGEGPTRSVRSARTVLPLAEYAAREPRFVDVLPRAAFLAHLDAAVRGAVTRGGHVNTRSLARVLRLDAEQIGAFAAAVARCTGRVDASRALASFRAAVLARYEEVPADVAWWVVVDPSAQFTASTCPTPATSEAWYGDAHEPSFLAPTKDETIEALLARLARDATEGAYGGTCALCFDGLGERNVVTLECGHAFHHGETASGCLGLRAWRNATCPTCRAPMEREAEPARAATVLHVEW